jgi:probable addiction module antidote protein
MKVNIKSKQNKETTKLYFSSKDIAKLVCYLENNDLKNFIQFLGKLSKSYGMTKISRECGRNRESLYKTFSKDANPKLNTIFDVIKCLGLTLTIKSIN